MQDALSGFFPLGREVEWRRINRLAGYGPNGEILPPENVEIDRTPNPMWRNRAFDGEYE